MGQSLEEIVKIKKSDGMSLIEIQKYLRDNNMIVPYNEVKIIFLKIK